MQALSAVGDKGDEAIIEVLTLKVGDLHTAVRVHAIEILGIMCPSTFSDSFPDVAVSVRKALRDDSRFVREMAATTLATVSTPGDPGSIQDLVRASSDPEPIVRKAAIVSLGMLAWANDQYVIKALTGRIHAAADETAEVLEAVHTAVTVLQDNTGKLLQQLKEDATEKNKEQQGTGNASHAKGLDDEYRKVSILGKLERKQQASLVASIKSADKVCTSDTVAF
jgi:HEAT repeat protein